MIATLAVLRRRWWVIALSVATFAGAAVTFSLRGKPQYSASASLLFRDPNVGETLFGTPPLITDPARDSATNLKLVSLKTVADRTARRLAGTLTGDDVAHAIGVAEEGQSDVVSITATDPSPRRAARLADTFAEQFIAFRRAAARTTIARAATVVEAQLTRLTPAERGGFRGRSLERKLEQLRILASLQTGNAELVQRADVPTSPSSPRPRRDGILGGLLGALLGVLLAFLFDRLDRTIRSPEELGATYELPLLGWVPEHRALARQPRPWLIEGPAREAFVTLRARLRYFNRDRDIRTVLVASPAPEEGKSTVAWHLAAAAAAAEETLVLLLEVDFRAPRIARTRRLRASPGLSDALASDAVLPRLSLADVVQSVPVSADGARRLEVAVAGALPPNPTELVESTTMTDLLALASEEYDLVVIDCPPSSIVPDSLPLMRQVDGVIVVGSVGRTVPDAVRDLRDQLSSVDVEPLGVVADRVRGARARSSDYSYYLSGRRASTARQRRRALERRNRALHGVVGPSRRGAGIGPRKHDG